MSNWTERIPTAFPETLLTEANALAAIIDPDTGGAFTFNADQTRGGYIYAEIPLMAHFEPVVRDRDLNTWHYAISQLADERGVERLSSEIVELLRTSLLFGHDECSVLNNEIL